MTASDPRHPDAELGDGVTVYPFVYIGPHATVESGVKLFPGVYVGENVRIGKGTTVYPNAVLMAGTHVGEGCILHPGSVLGADGFGFSDTRPAARREFKIDAASMVVRALQALADQGTIDRSYVKQAIDHYDLFNPNAAAPVMDVED